MADMTPATIICRFSHDAGEWVAHFEPRPQVAFGGNLPVVAIRRLLEGAESMPDAYPLRCNSDRAGSGVQHRQAISDPPELLCQCTECKGRGRYVGLREAEPCLKCGGAGRYCGQLESPFGSSRPYWVCQFPLAQSA